MDISYLSGVQKRHMFKRDWFKASDFVIAILGSTVQHFSRGGNYCDHWMKKKMFTLTINKNALKSMRKMDRGTIWICTSSMFVCYEKWVEREKCLINATYLTTSWGKAQGIHYLSCKSGCIEIWEQYACNLVAGTPNFTYNICCWIKVEICFVVLELAKQPYSI